ncbi:TATA-box-binding protein [Haloarcula argentinensis]|uniref:TATA-box-binding protein n=1 Tax=Haloarcula argentinensis TaxID=43776 RepID=A0A847UHP4_HALAR|nr:TATA-box-binding protein [Haloarcula argentinensis]NLV13235.1 TATA-box-binding protein [Haloarcula argentinensis]
MVEVVNVVGSGFLRREFDLSVVAEDLGSVAEFDPEKYPAIYIRFSDDDPLITVYRTGKFIITGAGSIGELHEMKEELMNCMSSTGIVSEDDLEWFKVQNLVCTTVLGADLNLSALAIGLGLEQTEYEPEQFPGLIYRNPDFECVVLIFSTGKAVITGSSDFDDVEAVADYLKQELSSLQLN